MAQRCTQHSSGVVRECTHADTEGSGEVCIYIIYTDRQTDTAAASRLAREAGGACCRRRQFDSLVWDQGHQH